MQVMFKDSLKEETNAVSRANQQVLEYVKGQSIPLVLESNKRAALIIYHSRKGLYLYTAWTEPLNKTMVSLVLYEEKEEVVWYLRHFCAPEYARQFLDWDKAAEEELQNRHVWN